jgi:hypothetical protein
MGSDKFMFRNLSCFLLWISTLVLFPTVKIHAAGFEWLVHPCGNYWDQNWVVANDPSGDVLAAGYYNSSPLQFGNISVSKCYPTTLREAFLSLISDSALSLPDVRLFPEFLVFPVPTRDRLYFRYPNPNYFSLSGSIQDLSGKTILHLNAIDFSSGVDLSPLNPGVYLLTVNDDSIHVVRKIIKM